jgi:serine/threonine protein kinase/tetratricopeptide (TPR) repeat protein
MKSLDLSVDLSEAPSGLRGLTRAQQERLTSVLDRYLSAIEQGEPLSRDELVAENPDLADALTAHFRNLDDLHGIAESANALSLADGAFDQGEIDRGAQRIGDFRIVREIGRGGMGIVYEAMQVSLSRRVALKILPFAAVLDPKQIARFKNEAQAAAQLYHPNIVPVYAVGVDRGVHYFAMKYIEGQPLDRAIAQLRLAQSNDASGTFRPNDISLADTVPYRLDPATPPGSMLSVERRRYIPTVIRLGIQAAEALHAAHEVGIVHRDIKPSNLMLDDQGRIWVTDFGLARCQTDASLTRTGDLIGTARYMSPEQASGRSALVDQRTDVYSLGATLYELLTLEPAFAGDDVQALLRLIDQEEPRRLRQHRSDIPVDLETVIAKAMAKHPAERYTTAEEFAADLRRVLDGKPTQARAPTPLDRMVKWTRRHTRLVLAATAISMLATFGLVAATLLVNAARQNADDNFVRAEKHFRSAHNTVDRFGAALAERLATVPGAIDVRRDLLQETMRYYRDFALEARDNPELRADLALTYSKMGTLAEEIGSQTEAAEFHRHSIELFEHLAADHPQESEYRRRLALAHNNLATLLSRSGDAALARSHFDAAIEMQQQLLTQSPESRSFRGDLALTYGNLGLLDRDTKDDRSAETALGEAIRLQEKLVGEKPDDLDEVRRLASSYNNLSALYLERDPARAKKLFDKALDRQQQLVAARPYDVKLQSELAVTHNNLGSIHSRAGRIGEAADHYAEAIEAQERLVRMAPQQRSYQKDLAVTLSNLGLAQTQLKQTSDAEVSFRRALHVGELLAKRSPRDAEIRSMLGGTFNNLAYVFEESGRTREAAAAYDTAIEHQAAAFSAADTVQRYREFLSTHYFNYGRVLSSLGRYDEAVAAAKQRQKLWPRDAQRLPTVAEELAVIHQTLVKQELDKDAAAGGQTVTPESCEALILDALRAAKKAGLSDTITFRDRASFASLRDRPAFAPWF